MKQFKAKLLFCLIFFISFYQATTQQSIREIISEKEFFNAYQFRCVGPTRGGRVTTVEGIPSQPETFRNPSSISAPRFDWTKSPYQG